MTEQTTFPLALPTLAGPEPLTFIDADGFTITFAAPVLAEIVRDDDGRYEAVLRLLPGPTGAVFTVRRPESTPIHDALRKERSL